MNGFRILSKKPFSNIFSATKLKIVFLLLVIGWWTVYPAVCPRLLLSSAVRKYFAEMYFNWKKIFAEIYLNRVKKIAEILKYNFRTNIF